MLNLNFKSQISFFVILSLVSIVLIVYVINLESTEISENLDSYDFYENHAQGNVKLFLDTCYKNSYFKSLQNIGFHGGNFISKDLIPTNYINFTNLSNYSYTPYFINNNLLILNKTEIETQFNLGIKYNFNKCLNLKNVFNLSFNISSIKSNTKIYDNNKIKITSNLLITSNSNSKSFKKTYSSFSFTDDYSYLINYLNISKQISLNILKYKNQICISCNKRLEDKYLIKILTKEIINDDLNIIIYFLINENLEYNDIKYYSFMDLKVDLK